MGKRGVGKFLAGAALGGALGVLFAPKKGSESRQDLKDKATDVAKKVYHLCFETERFEEEVKDLDKEKALDIAKQKAKQLKKQANDIVALAIEKGTPVLEKAAEEAKAKTISILNATIKKLESSQKTTVKKTSKTATKK